jgi:GNAT superfamily N-acetyltransferase
LKRALIRTANKQDWESIQRIYSYVVGPPSGQERAWSRLIETDCVLVADADGEIVGFGGIDLQATEQVKWLYLLPEYQGAGLGSQILAQLEQIGWNAGLSEIRLHAAPDATEFYRRHGYLELPSEERTVHDHEGVEMIKRRD